VRARLCMNVAAARGMRIARIRTGTGLATRADVPSGECRDGGPQLVIRGEHPVGAMPTLPRCRHEIGEPVEELKRRELDDVVGPRPRGPSPAARAD
jgi:hypothetical protein